MEAQEDHDIADELKSFDAAGAKKKAAELSEGRSYAEIYKLFKEAKLLDEEAKFHGMKVIVPLIVAATAALIALGKYGF